MIKHFISSFDWQRLNFYICTQCQTHLSLWVSHASSHNFLIQPIISCPIQSSYDRRAIVVSNSIKRLIDLRSWNRRNYKNPTLVIFIDVRGEDKQKFANNSFAIFIGFFTLIPTEPYVDVRHLNLVHCISGKNNCRGI